MTDADTYFRRFRSTGEPEHLARVFDELAPRLLLVAHHLTGRTHQSAEDLVQDTFVRAIEIAERFDGARPVLPWLIGILAGEAKNQKRRAARTADARRRLQVAPLVPPELAEAEEFHEALMASIEQLGAAYREVLTLRLIHGLTPTEIAHSLGRSPDTIKTQLRRGLERLRRALPQSFASSLAIGLTASATLAMAKARVLEVAAAHRLPAPPAATAAPLATAASTHTGGVLSGHRVAKPLLKAAVAAMTVATAALAVSMLMTSESEPVPVALPVDRTALVRTEVPTPPRRSTESAPAPADEQPISTRQRFTGKLLTAGGAPLGNTDVTLYRWSPEIAIDRDPRYLLPGDGAHGPRFRAGQTRTDDHGHFAIEGDWPRSLFLLRAGNVALPITETPEPGDPIDLGNLHTLAEGRIAGRIVGLDGRPLAGARVRASRLPQAFLERYPIDRLADAVALLPVGTIGLAPRVWQRVMQLADAPAAGAVLARPRWFDEVGALLPFEEVVSDAEGRFVLRALGTGDYTLIVNASDLRSQRLGEIRVHKGMTHELPTIRLTAGWQVSGRVFDAQGQRVAGAEVVVGAASAAGVPFHFASHRVTTDERGEFVCSGLDDSAVVASVRRGPGHPWTAVTLGDSHLPLTLALPRSHCLRFRLQSPSPEPIDTPRVQLLPGFDALPLARLGYLEPMGLEQRWSRDEHGRYVVEDLPRGKYTLLIDTPGHQLIARNLEVERDLEESYPLERRAIYTVTVMDAHWHPLEGAEVFARGVAGDHLVEPLIKTTVYCGVTDDLGQLEVGHIPGTSVVITAVHREGGVGHLALGDEQPGEPLIQLHCPGVIEGTLTDRGEPADPLEWMLAITPVVEVAALHPLAAFAHVDRDGAFRRRALLPGTHRVRAVRSLDAIRDAGALFEHLVALDLPRPTAEAESTEPRPVSIDTSAAAAMSAAEPAPVATEAAAPALATVAGIVVGPDGRPAPRTDVQLISPAGVVRPTRADWKGAYRFEGVADGAWVVAARASHPSRGRIEITVAGGQVGELDLGLRPGVLVQGHVRAPGGLRSIQLIRQDEHGNWLDEPVEVALDAAGAFTRPVILGAGRYQVTPGGLDVRASYPYAHYVTVGRADDPGLVVPRLVRNRVLPSGIVIQNPKGDR